MNRLSITHINSYFITSKLHGELVLALDGKGLRQKVYVPVLSRSMISKNKPVGLQHSEIHYAHSFSILDRWMWPLKMQKVWCDFNRQFAQDHGRLLHAHSLITNGLIAYRASKKWGIPYIVSVRFTDIHFFLEKGLFFRPLAWKILQNASAIIFISPAYLNTQIKKIFPGKKHQVILNKSFVIPNGINEYWIENRHSKYSLKNIRKLIFVGSVIRRKNLQTLIEACEILNNERFKIELTVVGDGPLLNKIKNQVYETKINFLGEISDRNRLIEVYQQSDVLVVSSIHETFGLVYPEAMSQGLPVIYTADQGFDGFFPDGHVGYAVKPYEPEDIAQKIKWVFGRYNTMSENAYHEVFRFSWDRVAGEFLDVYNKFCNDDT